jgi:putative hydrolase of the HAD superfamily
MHRPGHVLFVDAMGTLVRLAPPAPRLVTEVRRRFAVELELPDAERALAAEIAFYREHMGQGRDAAAVDTLRRECARVLAGALGPPLDGRDLRDTLLASLRFVAYPDARPALVAARARGARVVVVSNWDVSLGEVLERLGLAPLLHAVVTSAAVGAAKPAPEIFEHALALAGASAERACHVGDSVAQDVAGARACGIRAILIARRGPAASSAPAGVEVIGSLSELRWP